MENLKSKIESLLFICGDEIGVSDIRKNLDDVPEEDIRRAVESLVDDCRGRGVRVLIKDDKIQMVSAPENAEIISKLLKSQLTEQLSQAALETLSCIAYREPISKIEIDELRGVNSVFSLRNLSIRGLIEKTGAPENKDKKTAYYKTSLDFLKKLGIEKVGDLPHYDELSKPEQNNNEQ